MCSADFTHTLTNIIHKIIPVINSYYYYPHFICEETLRTKTLPRSHSCK